MELKLELTDVQSELMTHLLEFTKDIARERRSNGDMDPQIDSLLAIGVEEFARQMFLSAMNDMAKRVTALKEPCDCAICQLEGDRTIVISDVIEIESATIKVITLEEFTA